MGDPISMAAISTTFQVLFEKVLNTLSVYIHHEYHLLLGGDDQGVNQALTKLEDTLIRLRKVIRHDELKIFKNKETRDWYGSVRCAVNEADIILEEFFQSDSDDRHQQRVCNPFPTLFVFSVSKRNKFGERIASLLHKFDNLEFQQVQLNFDEIDLTLNRETMSTSAEIVFRRNDEREEIVKFLLSDPNTQNYNGPRVYAIVGLGGIGKTTLARLIYNDKRVEQNFASIIWVWVSQTFDVKKLMEKIIETHSKETQTFESLETTQNHLKYLLSGKKFLIVLDDVWNVKQEEWDRLKAPLKVGGSGSSILLTTRGADVVSTVHAHDQYKLAVLSEDQCWKVFEESAFLENQENGTLEVIGKQIAKRCGGLPLAAKSLGGSLRSTRAVRVWESTRDSYIWELPQPCDILPALKLSLDILDTHARDCFAFCCVFPKGYEMDRDELIQLWMANDFFPSHQILEPEDVGNQIFNELVLKSFFEISLEYDNVKMHDLMHDLAFSFGNKGFCWEEDQDLTKIPSGVLHLSWHPSRTIKFGNPSRTNILDTLFKRLPSLRTWILYDISHECDFPTEINFESLNHLRALDLRWNKMHNLPASIGKIKHLKYLSLNGCTGVTHLPDSICTLTKLQTLKVIYMPKLTRVPDGCGRLVHLRNLYLRVCSELTHLADGIMELVNLRCLAVIDCNKLAHFSDRFESLTNLRHLNLMRNRELKQLPDGISQLVKLENLDITSCPSLTQLPNRIGRLVNLRMLGLFVVGEQIGRRISELQEMNQLCGSLEIRGLEHVRDRGEAESAILKNKKNLSSLVLIWGDLPVNNNSLDEAEAKGVLEALQPPQSLNGKLVIRGYAGSVFPSWMRVLENLVRIELRDCTKCERLPPLGQLPLLKFLIVSGMKSLECISTEFYRSNGARRVIFPSLEELEFCNMANLKEWKDMEIMKDNQQTDLCPCLKQLKLSMCPNLISLPSQILSFVQDLYIYNCDKVIASSLSCLTSLELNWYGTNGVTSFPNGSLQNLDALESLEICDNSELTSLPDELSNLASLKSLTIQSCPALQSVPAMRSSIVEVHIHECQSLKSLSQSLQYLSTLKSLDVNNCDQLVLSSEDFQGLMSLQILSIRGLSKLTSLLCLLHLSTLKTLVVRGCDNLIKLWPHDGNNLTALETLRIESCQQLELSGADFQHLIKLQSMQLTDLSKLTSLPELQHLHSLTTLQIKYCEQLRVLPHGLQNFTSLKELWIDECHPELHAGCDKDTGQYWPFIKHIPKLYFKLTKKHLLQLPKHIPRI